MGGFVEVPAKPAKTTKPAVQTKTSTSKNVKKTSAPVKKNTVH